MKKFDRETYLTIGKNTFAKRPLVEEMTKKAVKKGFKSIFLVGSGGSYAMFIPFAGYIQELSTIPVYLEIAAELVLTGHNQLNSDALCIFTSSSGTTKETVAAAKYCKEKGASTLCISGNAEVEFALEADYTIVNQMDDFSASDADYILLYLVIFSLLHELGCYDEFDEFCKVLERLPELLVGVKEQSDQQACTFAKERASEPYHMFVGAGNVWGETYSFAMCVLEEMQWIRTKSVKAAEFFHGSLEIIESDTSLVVVMGEDELRPTCERVVRFGQRFTQKLSVFDTAEYELKDVKLQFRKLLSPIIMTAVLDRVSMHLEDVTGHSLDIRRYYRKVEY